MKSKRHKLIDKLDRVFGDYIRKRDKGVCFSCPKVSDPTDRVNYHAGHIFSRGYKALRWDERNVYGQCRGCNLRQNFTGNGEAIIWLVKKLGIDEVDKMRLEAHEGKKWTIGELEDKLEELK